MRYLYRPAAFVRIGGVLAFPAIRARGIHPGRPGIQTGRSLLAEPLVIRFPSDSVSRLRSFYEGRSVCVTGGAGFIGGHLVDTLHTLGATVSVIDDLSSSTLDHLGELLAMEPERIRFIQGSILDDDAVRDAVRGSAVVFHLAAIGSVPRSIEDPERTWQVNATGTLRVLQNARAHGVERVVFAASSSAYGDSQALPKIETQIPAPRSPYAASKLAGEHLISAWSHSYGLSGVSLRYFNVFGPRQAADSAYAAVVPAFIKRIASGEPLTMHGDGSQSRDFTYVGNAVLATLLAGSARLRTSGEVMNVGTGRRTTVRELATMIGERCGRPSFPISETPPRPGDVQHSLASLDRAKELIGYTPVVSLEEGLTETVAWYTGAASRRA